MSEEHEDEDALYPPKNARSYVWKYFGFKKINKNLPPAKDNIDTEIAICKKCRRSYKYNGNTTSMIFHLDHEHKEYKEDCPTPSEPPVKKIIQTKITGCFAPNTRAPLTASKKKKADRAFSSLIVDRMLPLKLGEQNSFKNFVQELDDRYSPPCRKAVLSDLQKMYDEVKGILKQELSGINDVALTHDAWTSINTQSYDTVTVHFISPDWQLRSAVLRTEKFPGQHTAENIAENLRSTVREWGLPQPTMVTDNAANEQKAIRLLEWTRIGCYGHRLNLAVKKSLEIPAISKLIVRGRAVVSYFHHSPLASDLLEQKQKLLLPKECFGHKLIQDVMTRWNSTFDMLNRILEQTPALHATVLDGSLGKKGEEIQSKLFTFEELKTVNSLVSVLEPFKKTTELLSGENEPTHQLVLPAIKKLQAAIGQKEDDLKAIKDVKAEMRNQLENRMAVDKDFCLIASLLSPTTKYLNFVSEQERGRARSLLELLCVSLSVKIKQESTEDSQQQVVIPALPSLSHDDSEGQDIKDTVTSQEQILSDDITESAPSSCKKIKLKTENWLDDIICVGSTPALPNDVLAKDELNRYLSEPQTTQKPLDWWKEKGHLYPRVSSLARKYLAVPASSVPSERIFSVAGSLVSKKRSQLKPENVNMMIFLRKNKEKFLKK